MKYCRHGAQAKHHQNTAHPLTSSMSLRRELKSLNSSSELYTCDLGIASTWGRVGTVGRGCGVKRLRRGASHNTDTCATDLCRQKMPPEPPRVSRGDLGPALLSCDAPHPSRGDAVRSQSPLTTPLRPWGTSTAQWSIYCRFSDAYGRRQ